METKTSEVTPLNGQVASNIGADNIDYAAEVKAAALLAVTGGLAVALGVSKRNVDSRALFIKVAKVVKSKRGLGEKNLPAEIALKLDEYVRAFVSNRADYVLSGDNVKEKQDWQFSWADTSNPVKQRNTIASTRTIGLHLQLKHMRTRVNADESAMQRAEVDGNINKANKLQETYEKHKLATEEFENHIAGLEKALNRS